MRRKRLVGPHTREIAETFIFPAFSLMRGIWFTVRFCQTITNDPESIASGRDTAFGADRCDPRKRKRRIRHAAALRLIAGVASPWIAARANDDGADGRALPNLTQGEASAAPRLIRTKSVSQGGRGNSRRRAQSAAARNEGVGEHVRVRFHWAKDRR